MSNFNFNKVILGGRLTADPELKQTTSGIFVCSFSIAVNRKKGKDEQEPKTDFITVQAWRQQAEFVSRFFKKGSSICIVGSIQTRSWEDNNGGKRYATEVIADEISFVDSKTDEPKPSYAPSYIPQDAIKSETPQFETVSGDDELPF